MKLKKFVKIGVATAAVAAACAYLLDKLKPAKHAKPKTDEAQNDFSAIAAGIAKNMSDFDGLYESLFQSVRNQNELITDAFKEWCDRVGQLNDEAFCGAFARRFSKEAVADEPLCRKEMEQLLSCIEQSGVRRERENGLVYAADEAMRRAYLTIDESKMEIGAEYNVLKAAWVYEDKVIEYGMAMRVAKNPDEGGK